MGARFHPFVRRLESPPDSLWQPFGLSALIAIPPRVLGLGESIRLDASVYLTVGSEWMHGTLPYRDLFDHKGPFAYLLFGLIDVVLPASVVAVRLALLAAFLLALFLLLRWVRAAGASPRAQWITGVVFSLTMSSLLYEGTSPNLEQFALPLLVGAVSAADAFSRSGRLPFAVCSGAAGGALLLIKPTLAIILPLLLVLVVLRSASALRAAAAFFAGLTLCCIGGLAPFILAGGLGDLRAAVVDYNSVYVGAALDWVRRQGPDEQLDFLLYVPGLALAVAAGFGGLVACFSPRYRRLALIASSWLVLELVGAKAGVNDFFHYFVPLLPAIAVLVAIGTDTVIEALAPEHRRLRALLPLAAVAPIFAGVYLSVPGVGGPVPRERQLGAGRAQAEGPKVIPDLSLVAATVKRATRRPDTVYVTGDQFQSIYWLADRRPASRQLFPGIALDPARAYAEIRRDLRLRPPAAVVMIPGTARALAAEIVRANDLHPLPPDDMGGVRIFVRGALISRR